MKYQITLLTLVLFSALVRSQLPKLNIDADDITLSGISSGAFMSTQFHVAFSSLIKGSFQFAGGPFWCAKGQITYATMNCMSFPMLLNVQELINKAQEYSKLGEIDDLKNLQGKKVYVYSGSKDSLVKTDVVKANEKFFDYFGAKVMSEYSIQSEHAWITDTWGGSCGVQGSPYINKCDYQSPKIPLEYVLDRPLNERVTMVQENLQTFDQTHYGSSSISFADKGWIYIPEKCKDSTQEKCGLHISFHGCQMTPSDIQDKFATHSGLNEFAESNNLVVLYPQLVHQTLKNPNGCYDWWGYTDANYATKNGKQMDAVYKMIKDLAGL